MMERCISSMQQGYGTRRDCLMIELHVRRLGPRPFHNWKGHSPLSYPLTTVGPQPASPMPTVELVNGRGMNGFLWTAVAFAIAGLLAIIASGFWGTDRTAAPHDFGPLALGLVLLALSEGI